jgi:DNA-binding transcriptional regulator YhcF (GntR family)
MLLKLDEQDPAPLYAQIATAVRRAVLEGELAEGDRLPPAREMATALGVNMHTVLRGYQELVDEGVVTMRRGRGVTVCGNSAAHLALLQEARALIDRAGRTGVHRTDLIAMIKAMP